MTIRLWKQSFITGTFNLDVPSMRFRDRLTIKELRVLVIPNGCEESPHTG